MIHKVKQVLAGRRCERICECRHCGTTVETPSDNCPTCGSQQIARYEI